MSGPGEPAPTRWSGTHLAIAAVGIVFGDIGTSPLHAMRECFGEHGVAPTAENVLGVLSLMLWSLTLPVLPRGRSHMAYWRKVLFRFICRNARATTDYFSIPPGRVVELGMQIDL